MGTERLSQIDALRGIAALAVALVFHQHYLLGVYRTGPLDGLPLFSTLHQYGWMAVDLFFVISGFIFSHVYLVEGEIKASARQFTLARFARLYPLHFVTLVLAAGILAFATPPTLGYVQKDAWHFVLNLFMLNESGLNSHMSFNIPAWSISVEVLCYVIFFVLGARYPKILLPLAFVLAICGLLATTTANARLDHIARGICGFFCGVLAYRARNAPWWFPAVLMALAFAIVPNVRGFSLGAVMSLTAFPAAVIFAGRVGFLSAKPLIWLGDRSYSIYMVHAPIYMGLSVFAFAAEPVPKELWVAAMLTSWCLILLAADASYRWLEAPARKYIRNWGNRARDAQPQRLTPGVD